VDLELLLLARSLPISVWAEAATATAAGKQGGEGEGKRHAVGREGKERREEMSEGRGGDDHPELGGRREGHRSPAKVPTR
jgi:hypothetical protein